MSKDKKNNLDKLIESESSNEDNFFINQLNNKEQNMQKISPLQNDWLEDDAEGQLSIDVYQDEDNVYVKSTIAGAKPEDIDISVHNDMLTIRGKRQKEEKIKDENYLYQECFWGKFSRSIILPTEVDVDNIKANLKDGILTITLPKIKNKSIPIEINSEK